MIDEEIEDNKTDEKVQKAYAETAEVKDNKEKEKTKDGDDEDGEPVKPER